MTDELYSGEHWRAGSPLAPVVAALLSRWIFCWLLFPLFLAAHTTVGTQYEVDGYSRLAAGIASGHGYRVAPDMPPNLNRPPAYALLLTLTQPGGRHAYLLFQALNGLLGAAAVWITWKVGAESGLSRRASSFAAWSLALWPFSIWETKVSVPENLLVAIIPALIYALVRWKRRGSLRWALAAGSLAAFAALTHGLEQLLVPALPLLMLLAPLPWKRRIFSATAAFAVALILLAPWVIRNEKIAGYHTGVSTGFGLHYLKGISDYELLLSGKPYFRDNDDAAMRRVIAMLAVRGFKVPDDETLRNDPAINHFLDQAARRDLQRRPWFNATKTALKIPLLWIQQQTANRAMATALLLLPWFFLALAGALRRPGWLFASIAAVLILLNAGAAAVFIEAMPMRYALPLLPLLFLLSARGLDLASAHSPPVRTAGNLPRGGPAS